MRRSLCLVVLALLLATTDSFAQGSKAPAKRRVAPRPVQVPKSQIVEDRASSRGYFAWKHYAVNPLAPDEFIQAPVGVDPTDGTQIRNIILNSAGYEKANLAIREGMAGSFFGSPVAPLPDKFWNEVVGQFRDGKVDEFCVENGERAGDFPMASGSKLDAQGNTRSYIEGPYPVNETGGGICGWKVREPILIEGGPYDGKWARPIIYKRCRNTTGFAASAPIPTLTPMIVEKPEPAILVPQASVPAVTAPGAIATAVVNIHLPEAHAPAAAAVVVEKHGICGKAAWKCWVPPLVALCAWKCDFGGDDDDESAPAPNDITPQKTPTVVVTRPIQTGLRFSVRF